MRVSQRVDEDYGATVADGSKRPDERGAERFALLIRTAKLIVPEGEFLCVVRDASDSGVNIRLFHELPENDRVMLELQNGDRHELEMVWQDQARAGLRFLQDADVRRFVECPSRFAKRPIRLNLKLAGHILTGEQQHPVTIHDLSQQGAKLVSDFRFSIDQQVRLVVGDVLDVRSKIRWRRDDACGLVFEDTFQFGDLARAAARLQGIEKAL